MRHLVALVALVIVMFAPGCASAQTSGPRPFRTLTSNVSQVDATATREIRIQWTSTPLVAGTASAQPVNSFAVLQQRTTTQGLRRERDPQLSANHLVVVVQNAAGRELDWRTVLNPRILRAESPGRSGELTGRTLEQSSAELLLTIPDIPGADRLQIYRPIWNGKDYDLELLAQVVIGTGLMKGWLALATVFAVAGTAYGEPVVPIRMNGSAQNRIGVAILGDGYTAADQVKYSTDVDLLVKAVFDQQPYATYAAYFNVFRVDVVSNESGADHPERSAVRDTALGASYNCQGIQRLICVDGSAVNTVLSRSLPANGRDIVIVLVNDAEYGGSGGAFTIASANIDVVELVLHEGGHSFGLLGDEYTTQPPACVNDVEPAEANIAKAIARDTIKWSRWIAAATSLPTSGTTSGVPGAFAGARYCSTGLYRPTFDSKMRSLGRPFEQVNTEQLIRRIYNFVSPIDGLSPAATDLMPPRGASVDFSVDTPRPASYELSVKWFVNGVEVGQGSALHLNTTLMAGGMNRVEVEVSDPTTAVRNDPDGLLSERRGWNVIVEQATAEEVRKAFEDLLRRWRG